MCQVHRPKQHSCAVAVHTLIEVFNGERGDNYLGSVALDFEEMEVSDVLEDVEQTEKVQVVWSKL